MAVGTSGGMKVGLASSAGQIWTIHAPTVRRKASTLVLRSPSGGGFVGELAMTGANAKSCWDEFSGAQNTSELERGVQEQLSAIAT